MGRPDAGKGKKEKPLGGAFSHTYAYDELNRLVKAEGKAKGIGYVMDMSFGLMGEPLTKVQRTDSGSVAGSYALAYEYGDADHPTAPSQIGHERYTYDANGNPTLVEDDSLNTERRMAWDEENRLTALSDNGKTSRYTYNAAGERIVKSHGYLEGVYVNGAPQGLTFHETEDYTIYPAPILSVTRQRFTKHYFIGDRRVASKIGAGIFQNAYGHGANVVTAGQKDYQMRMMQIERQREDYYRKLGTPPGVPTMKGATAEPENTHEGYNTIIRELGDHSVPDGWIQRPKRNAVPGTPPGPPVQWDKAEDPDDVQPGYGYVPADTTHHEDIFFYHTDHLGSTSYITDAKANVAQFDAYLPYGELLVDEHSSSEEMPYKFNGKEFDEETGLYYYGARYMNPRTSLWYGVDPLAEMYPSVGSFCYSNNNPIVNIDPMGKSWEPVNEGGKVISLQDKEHIHSYKWLGYDKDAKGNFIPKPNTVETAYVFGKEGMTTLSSENYKPRMTWQSYKDISTGDKASDNRIASLHPYVQNQMKAFVLKAELRFDVDLRVVQGYRTYEEQDKLYAQGRTAPGSIVTKARGGFSNHNFGLAVDVVPFENGKLNWETKNYPLIGTIGKSVGLEWGGDWKSIVDRPHFQNMFGYSLKQLRNPPKDNKGLPILNSK